MEHPSEVTNMSVTDLAEKSNASEAIIMRLSKKDGYKEFYHFKIALARSVQEDKKETNFELDLTEL